MTGDEFVTRSRQELGKRIDGLLAGLGHDFSEAPRATGSKPKFFFDPEDVPEILSLLKQRLPDEYSRIVPRAERICAHRFDLLGYRGLDYGKEIDWSLDRVHGQRAPKKPFYKLRYLDFQECGDVKVTWELNRHQHLVTLAKASRITGDPRFADEFFEQWEHWDQENPYPYGVNWASSLELAFRSLSWLWAYYLLGEVADQRSGFREQFLRSISVHGRAIERYLSTYFSPNTHLLGEAVALFFTGVLCPELPSAERWENLGWKITLQEAQRQVRPDGMHFEQSLYYHV
jgi:heparinase II/III-like protein